MRYSMSISRRRLILQDRKNCLGMRTATSSTPDVEATRSSVRCRQRRQAVRWAWDQMSGLGLDRWVVMATATEHHVAMAVIEALLERTHHEATMIEEDLHPRMLMPDHHRHGDKTETEPGLRHRPTATTSQPDRQTYRLDPISRRAGRRHLQQVEAEATSTPTFPPTPPRKHMTGLHLAMATTVAGAGAGRTHIAIRTRHHQEIGPLTAIRMLLPADHLREAIRTETVEGMAGMLVIRDGLVVGVLIGMGGSSSGRMGTRGGSGCRTGRGIFIGDEACWAAFVLGKDTLLI